MKIAIITDIHGNSPALQAVLEEIDDQKIEKIVCLGDIVGIGPDTNEVIELLICRSNIDYVLGNHDRAVIAAFNNEPPPSGHFNERGHHQWIAEQIKPEYIDFINRFPMSLTYEVMGNKILFVHYHLKDNDFIPIEKEPSVEKLEQLYDKSNYVLVCFGHHHIVHEFKSQRRQYFNPGSLGCYQKPLARYGILEVNKESINIQLREVPYNNKEFLKSYKKLQVPESDFILKVFHGGQT